MYINWSPYAAQQKSELDSSYAVADTTAAREAGDYEASANQQTAARTNSLAQRLATARRMPGGGIRTGIRRKGFSASTAGIGLNAANAKDRLDRRKSELRAAAAKDNTEKYNALNSQLTWSIGEPIRLW